MDDGVALALYAVASMSPVVRLTLVGAASDGEYEADTPDPV